MWVIYCEDSGIEVDRIEDNREAHEMVNRLTRESIFGYEYGMRWEA